MCSTKAPLSSPISTLIAASLASEQETPDALWGLSEQRECLLAPLREKAQEMQSRPLQEAIVLLERSAQDERARERALWENSLQLFAAACLFVRAPETYEVFLRQSLSQASVAFVLVDKARQQTTEGCMDEEVVEARNKRIREVLSFLPKLWKQAEGNALYRARSALMGLGPIVQNMTESRQALFFQLFDATRELFELQEGEQATGNLEQRVLQYVALLD